MAAPSECWDSVRWRAGGRTRPTVRGFFGCLIGSGRCFRSCASEGDLAFEEPVLALLRSHRLGGDIFITRARGNVIHEIDGRPALDVLKEYLLPEEIDNWDKAVISLCLGFKTPAHLEGYDEYTVRFIPARDEANCSISIQTEVPTGGDVWMNISRHRTGCIDSNRANAIRLSGRAL